MNGNVPMPEFELTEQEEWADFFCVEAKIFLEPNEDATPADRRAFYEQRKSELLTARTILTRLMARGEEFVIEQVAPWLREQFQPYAENILKELIVRDVSLPMMINIAITDYMNEILKLDPKSPNYRQNLVVFRDRCVKELSQKYSVFVDTNDQATLLDANHPMYSFLKMARGLAEKMDCDISDQLLDARVKVIDKIEETTLYKNFSLPCVECGKPFVPRRVTAKYCSTECRVKANNRKTIIPRRRT